MVVKKYNHILEISVVPAATNEAVFCSCVYPLNNLVLKVEEARTMPFFSAEKLQFRVVSQPVFHQPGIGSSSPRCR